jgi:hypothetical protein
MDFQKRLQGEIGVPLIKEITRQNGEVIENEDYASAGLRSQATRSYSVVNA